MIGLGSHDLDTGQTLARARLHLAELLDSAERLRLKTFVVGPPPRRDVAPKIQADLSRAFSDVYGGASFPTWIRSLPSFSTNNWNTDMTVSDGYAQQAGYGLMAWLVLHNGWNQWLGVGSTS